MEFFINCLLSYSDYEKGNLFSSSSWWVEWSCIPGICSGYFPWLFHIEQWSCVTGWEHMIPVSGVNTGVIPDTPGHHCSRTVFSARIMQNYYDQVAAIWRHGLLSADTKKSTVTVALTDFEAGPASQDFITKPLFFLNNSAQHGEFVYETQNSIISETTNKYHITASMIRNDMMKSDWIKCHQILARIKFCFTYLLNKICVREKLSRSCSTCCPLVSSERCDQCRVPTPPLSALSPGPGRRADAVSCQSCSSSQQSVSSTRQSSPTTSLWSCSGEWWTSGWWDRCISIMIQCLYLNLLSIWWLLSSGDY